MTDRVTISNKLFGIIFKDIFLHYKKDLQQWENPDDGLIKEVQNFIDSNFQHISHGRVKYLFAKKHDDLNKCSVGYSINKLLARRKHKIEIDISDFLYKKYFDYKKGESDLEIYESFVYALGYPSLKDYCINKNESYEKNVHRKKNDAAVALSEDKKLEKYLVGGWWLYFYNNEGFGKDPALASSVLEITDLNNMKLFNETTEDSLDYIGKVDDSLTKIEGVIYLRFNPVDSVEDRNLRMAFHVSKYVTNDLAIGQYTNIDRGVHLIRGSVCMEKIKDYKIGDCEKTDNKFIPKRAIEDIPDQFRRFLADKKLNFNRLPNSQFNLPSFSDWLIDQTAKRNLLHKKVQYSNKKLFISCPIKSVTVQQFQALRALVLDISEYFKENQFNQVYSFILELDNQEEKYIYPRIQEYQKAMEKFSESTYHLAIWPNDLKPSGIIFELGWAVMRKIPIVIFEQYDKKANSNSISQIPYLIQGACWDKETYVTKYEFQEFDEILPILKKNEMTIFPGYPKEAYFS